ncbi:MAG: C4-type zinc ribbon domain-containing protein [Bacteroides sp.]|nr:C4-type zinc ribbon domain-containing protein [Bacteroides sp.]MCM1085544.1 C4-type zinc ribbon domain-containing protein [Bacteroides sp.]MCM1169962.1 C4-type zinc ribbon domain-containing protein [Bacteroides sp.]
MKEKAETKTKAAAKKAAAQPEQPAQSKVVSDERDAAVEQKLVSLYALQSVDSAIDDIRILRGELPLEVQDLEDDIAGYQSKIEKLKADMEEISKNIADRKSAMTEIKAQVKKYEKQLREVKNSREYDALNKEIEFQNLENQLHEKKIREANMTLEKRKAELERNEEACAERQKDLEVKKGELDEIVAETEKDEKALMAKSEEYQKNIEPRWLRLYERIRNNAHNGLAVVRVDRDACGGCFSKIPPQRQIDIRMHKKIISCEYCGRFLVDDSICEQAEEITGRNK